MNHILDRLWSSNTERLCNRTSFFGGNLPFSKDGIHQGDKAIRGNAHNRPGKGRNAAIRSQKVNSACCDARIADEISSLSRYRVRHTSLNPCLNQPRFLHVLEMLDTLLRIRLHRPNLLIALRVNLLQSLKNGPNKRKVNNGFRDIVLHLSGSFGPHGAGLKGLA